MTHTKRIEPDILAVLAACTVEQFGIRINGGQLDRKTYDRVNDVLTLMGGKWNRSKRLHVFADNHDGIEELLDQVVETGEITDTKKQFQFYETPEVLAQRMVALADMRTAFAVLEPSAGHGAIANAIMRASTRPVIMTCIEVDPSKAAVLHAQGLACHIADFMGIRTLVPEYEAIVMNPPFSNRQDIKHIRHALAMLAPGGRLVAICSAGPGRTEQFEHAENWDGVSIPTPPFRGAAFHTDHWEELPADTFKASGANVRTILMRIRRAS